MLTNTECKQAVCPEGKTRIRLSDSGNLYLEVAATGSKRWFWKYTFDGKEKRLALGMYPATSLKDARIARDDARKLHLSGVDAAEKRRLDKLSRRVAETDTFEGVAREYHATRGLMGAMSRPCSRRGIKPVEATATRNNPDGRGDSGGSCESGASGRTPRMSRLLPSCPYACNDTVGAGLHRALAGRDCERVGHRPDLRDGPVRSAGCRPAAP